MNPLTTHGKAFMGKMRVLSSARQTMVFAGLTRCPQSRAVVKVAKGTNTGVQAQRKTQTASRYFLQAK
eukprot:scaffold4592_cov169-Ochromonas_danica.AAC.1